MRAKQFRTRKRNTGSTMIELALTLPLLLLSMLGAVDFGRVFYHAVTVVNAAGVGAYYGSQNAIKSGHYSTMNSMATQDAGDVSGVTATSTRFCDCPNGNRVDCFEGSCGAYGSPRVYVQTRVQESFRPIVKLPGIPNPVVITRDAYFRVQ